MGDRPITLSLQLEWSGVELSWGVTKKWVMFCGTPWTLIFKNNMTKLMEPHYQIQGDFKLNPRAANLVKRSDSRIFFVISYANL